MESIGVEKAKKLATEADLVIFVVDSTRTLDENDKDIISLIQDKKVITLLNKSDLTPVVTPEEMKKRLDCCVIPISAKEETDW